MPHKTDITVDWGDTDAGGLIYYPQFFHFMIVGLNDYFSLATDGEHPMEAYRKDGYVLPAVEASASFNSPLRAGDEVILETTVVDSRTSSLTVAFVIARAETDERVASGEVSFVFVDDTFESSPLPEEIQECIRSRGDA